ncbi:hypothetical protein BIW11_11676 [Tropilaelaps mercedesae]|uniref:Secreted protein n=1 Tax=Tropilaelaps mercedesae TaxID=418985 RepID=A0A1V9X9Z9_9ACAR|nr:hypothetical protein BIW11_11676 [Tropilaelaps mercedesae]
MQAYSVLVILLLATAAFAQNNGTPAQSISDVTQGPLICLKITIEETIDNTRLSMDDFLRRLSPEEDIAKALNEIDGRTKELNTALNQIFKDVVAEKIACEERNRGSLRPTFCGLLARTSYVFRSTEQVTFFTADVIKIIINAKIKYSSNNVLKNILTFVRELSHEIRTSLKAGVACFLN